VIVLLDNYDSFTYNLYQYISELNQEVLVLRNDKTTSQKIEDLNPSHLVISPGPSNPDNAGISKEVIDYFSKKIPILGVCLGHQCIASTFGANIIQSKEIMHGKISLIEHDGKGIFKNIPNPFKAVRYHSLIIEEDSLSNDFEVSARSEIGIIQGIRHKSLRLEGVQFHPESIETENGKDLLNNFINS
jgi:para-aminobenzoate synthetase component 2